MSNQVCIFAPSSITSPLNASVRPFSRSRYVMPPGLFPRVSTHTNSRPRQTNMSLVVKRAVERDGLNGRTHIAGAVNRERITEAHVHLAEIQRALEQSSLRLGRGDLGAALAPRTELRRALALFAMMVVNKTHSTRFTPISLR